VKPPIPAQPVTRVAIAIAGCVVIAGTTLQAGGGQAPQIARTIEAIATTFVCGTDATMGEIPVRSGTVVLAADGRIYIPCPKEQPHGVDHREARESTLLSRARQSRDEEVQWRAVQAMVRLGTGLGIVYRTARVVPVCNAEVQIFGGLNDPTRWQPGELFRLLRSPSPRIRREAAFGIGLGLSKESESMDLVSAARREIEVCLLGEKDTAVQALLMEAVGAARYGKDADRAEAERMLVDYSKRVELEVVLGAMRGLEALTRQSPKYSFTDETRQQLRTLAVREPPGVPPGQAEVAARLRRLAMMALQSIRDEDVLTLELASQDRDWQVRRLVAMRLNLSDPQQARIGTALAKDPALQVRYDYLGALSRLATRTRLCAPLVDYLEDPEPIVAMRSMDLVSASCTDLDEAVEKLVAHAEKLTKPESHERWHIPSHALTALARVRPTEAEKLIQSAAGHQIWQVRAAAAPACVQLGRSADAVKLASDAVPNVRTSAIEALVRAKDAAVIEPAIEALQYGTDFQLLRSAAGALFNVPEEKRDDATQALLGAFRRLTLLQEDPSRDPRVAILNALERIMRPERASEILSFMVDFDDTVNAAAARSFATLTGGQPMAVSDMRDKLRRYPYQPPESALADLPVQATIVLETGAVDIALLPDVAPVTIARFKMLAETGYYNGLTFHRIAPNFVVQGGSPGANEYVGTARYMRDEVSAMPHLRGAVGISTRGADTGDAQIFIDLVDVPRLDRTYTVFGYVVRGMEYVDRMLEGAVIKGITFRQAGR
jgi:cyclophilin family peptidyl-prolyl cis-trans isomerase/HEAT repeat protein